MTPSELAAIKARDAAIPCVEFVSELADRRNLLEHVATLEACLRGVSSCSTCDVCRGAAMLVLGERTGVSAPEIGAHEWFQHPRLPWRSCRKCGIVERRDGTNRACVGKVNVVLRGATDSADVARRETKFPEIYHGDIDGDSDL